MLVRYRLEDERTRGEALAQTWRDAGVQGPDVGSGHAARAILDRDAAPVSCDTIRTTEFRYVEQGKYDVYELLIKVLLQFKL